MSNDTDVGTRDARGSAKSGYTWSAPPAHYLTPEARGELSDVDPWSREWERGYFFGSGMGACAMMDHVWWLALILGAAAMLIFVGVAWLARTSRAVALPRAQRVPKAPNALPNEEL